MRAAGRGIAAAEHSFRTIQCAVLITKEVKSSCQESMVAEAGLEPATYGL